MTIIFYNPRGPKPEKKNYEFWQKPIQEVIITTRSGDSYSLFLDIEYELNAESNEINDEMELYRFINEKLSEDLIIAYKHVPHTGGGTVKAIIKPSSVDHFSIGSSYTQTEFNKISK